MLWAAGGNHRPWYTRMRVRGGVSGDAKLGITGPDLNYQVSEDWHSEHQCSCSVPTLLFSAGTLTNYEECPCGKLWDRFCCTLAGPGGLMQPPPP